MSPTATIRNTNDRPHVSGVAAFFRNLMGYRDQQAAGCQRGVVAATNALALLAEYYTPIDTGELISSQAVLYTLAGFDTVGHIQYTDPKAAEVHETLSYAHGKEFNAKHAAAITAGLTHARREQEQAKFLERPMRENEAQLQAIILESIRRAS